jgi:hypothetical protein
MYENYFIKINALLEVLSDLKATGNAGIWFGLLKRAT